MATLITRQPELINDIERIKMEVLVKEPMTTLGQLNQINIKFSLYQRIKKAQQKDNKFIKIMEKVQRGEMQEYTMDKGMLKLRHQVCASQSAELKKNILAEVIIHGTPEATKIYQELQHTFWWEEMKKDIANFVQRCLVCQQLKVE